MIVSESMMRRNKLVVIVYPATLSWYTVAGACGCPCPIRKFLRCNNMFAESDVATSSASVLDFVTIDCLVDSTDTGPLSPMVRHAPVCDFPSSWIP